MIFPYSSRILMWINCTQMILHALIMEQISLFIRALLKFLL